MQRKIHQTSNEKTDRQWWILLSLMVMLMLSTFFSTMGCKTRTVVIPADKAAVRLPANQAYTPAVPGWFVPDARMREILLKLQEK
jgi:hypothetical protein